VGGGDVKIRIETKKSQTSQVVSGLLSADSLEDWDFFLYGKASLTPAPNILLINVKHQGSYSLYKKTVKNSRNKRIEGSKSRDTLQNASGVRGQANDGE